MTSLKLYTLKELYSQAELRQQIVTGTHSIFGSLVPYDDNIIIFLCDAIYRWYCSNYVAFTNEDNNIEDIKDRFIYRLTDDFASAYSLCEMKIKHYLSINDLTKLYISGGLNSETIIKPDLESTNFTKQASTPSVVAQTSDFVDAYTDYQSKSTSSHKGTDTHNTSLERSGSQEDALNVLNLLPKSLFDEMIDAVSDNFFTIMGDEK